MRGVLCGVGGAWWSWSAGALLLEVRRLRAQLADAEDALRRFDLTPYFAPGHDRETFRMEVDALVEKLREANSRPYARRRYDW